MRTNVLPDVGPSINPFDVEILSAGGSSGIEVNILKKSSSTTIGTMNAESDYSVDF